MSKEIFDISDGAWEQDIQAVKVFTDREDPQEAFERKFRVLSKNWKKTFYVMCYYGIGGIGKTSFVNKLCRVIKNIPGNDCRLLDKIDCNYIHYDFDAKNAGSDKYSILVSWRKMIMETDPHFKFFRFDSAILLYSKKTGSTIEKDETAQSVLENNPWLNVLVTGIGALPVIGWISNATQAFDQATNATISAISNQFDKKRYQAHLTEIESMEPPEIIDKLHEYFILDMRDNMQYRAKKPLVIFLDTYEKYIDTVNREISMITEDRWLRKGRRSVIQSIPGILWVITGRERLYWAQDDCIWESEMPERPLDQMTEAEKEDLAHELLEQHLLGDLSFKDASYFLQQANVPDNTLYEPLYQLTNGTPLFLDICVDNYHDLLTKGNTPTIDDFGTDLTELISRYLSNMQNEAREMAYFLACLGTWTDDFVNQVASKSILLKNYTYARYKDFSKLSFIIQNPDGSFYMHETVATAALENADEEFVKEISSIKLCIFTENLADTDILGLNTTISNYVRTLTSALFSYNEYLCYLQEASSHLQSVKQNGSYDLLLTLNNVIFMSTKEKYPDSGAELIATVDYAYALVIKGIYDEARTLLSKFSLEENFFQLEQTIWFGILHTMGIIYIRFGEYEKARALLLQAIDGRTRILGADHPDTLDSMLPLAASYARLGKYETALELVKQVLEARTQILGPNHPDTLTAINSLAADYAFLGKYEMAHPLFKQVLEARTRILGPDHPATLSVMSNLATTYTHLGNHESALELYKQVLEARTRILGPEHPDTLTAMSNLATTYTYLGNHESALELEKQVLEARTRILGPEHPDTLSVMNNLAITYTHLGKHESALELKKQVLEARTRILGPEHPDTLTAMSNLATTYTYLGNHESALELEKQVLEARTRILGPEHPDTLSVMNNLAITYTHLGNHESALELKKQVLEARTRILGPEHPATLSVMSNLATTYTHLGNHESALELYKQVLEARTRILGPEHPDTLTAMSNLATTYTYLGNHESALELEKQVLEARTQILGPEHPDTLSVMNNLAITYTHLGNHESALELYKQVLEASTRILGPEHPDTLTAMSNLATTYTYLGNHESALELEKQVLEARTRILGPEHPDTISALQNIGTFYSKLGIYEMALQFRKQALDNRTQILGLAHPDTQKSLSILISTYNKLEQYETALELSKQLLAIRTRILGENHPDTIESAKFVSFFSAKL